MEIHHPDRRSNKEKDMRNALLPVLLTGLIVGAAIAFAVVTSDQKQVEAKKDEKTVEVLDTTPKLLIADPAFYKGRIVRVRISGCEYSATGEYIYRTRTDLPPVVVLRLRVPKPLPVGTEWVVGVCAGRVDTGEVLVLDCR